MYKIECLQCHTVFKIDKTTVGVFNDYDNFDVSPLKKKYLPHAILWVRCPVCHNIGFVKFTDLYKDNEKLFLHLKRELSFFY